MNYDSYLFSCLLKEYDKEFAEKPYDEQYYLINGMYNEFENSGYDDRNIGLYECLTNYFDNKYNGN